MNEYTVLTLAADLSRASEQGLYLTGRKEKRMYSVIGSRAWIPHGHNRTVLWTAPISVFNEEGRRVCLLRPTDDGVVLVFISGEADPSIGLFVENFSVIADQSVPREFTGNEISFAELQTFWLQD